MDSFETRQFLSNFRDDLKILDSHLHFKKDEPCELMPWLILKDYLSGKSPEAFMKDNLFSVKNRIKEFENMVSVLPDYKTDFIDLLAEISALSNGYIKSYESFIPQSLENEIRTEQKGKDWKIDKDHFLSINQYKKLYDLSKEISEILKLKWDSNQPVGFICELPEKTVENIYFLMKEHKPNPQIGGELNDFKAIFHNENSIQKQIDKPINWLITHDKKVNNAAFQTFLRLMLDLRNRELSRDTLKQANKLFIFNGKPIYPNDDIKYPSSKEKGRWMKSSIAKHFSKISHLIEKQD